MKIATFNVNGVNGRLPVLLAWLRETQPDVACLQETKTSDDRFPVEPLAEAGYTSVWHGMPRHHGVAVLSRDGTLAEARRGLPGDDADGQARYLEADVQGIRVVSVYLPNGNPHPGPKFDYKLAWMKRLTAHAKKLYVSKAPMVLAGDFNVVPTNADIYNPWAWRFDAVLQPETRAAWQQLLAQGWVDATRHLHPNDRVYTFWVNAAAFRRNAGFRMDFLMLNPAAAARLSATGVDAAWRGRERASDHAPVWISLTGR